MKSAQVKIDLIDKWAAFFLSKTESWYSDQAGELGGQLAYLFSAMATDISVELTLRDELVLLLRANYVPDTEDIWEYIDIIEED